MSGSSSLSSRAARRRSERQLAAERLHAVTNRGRPGWVPTDPGDDVEVAAPGRRRGADLPRGRDGHEEEPVDRGRPVRDSGRARLLDRLPWTVRAARFSVPPAVVLALLALVGLLALVVAVRTASATPGTPVPVRSPDTASSDRTAEPAPGPDGARGGRDVGPAPAAEGGAGSAPRPVSGPASGPPTPTAASGEVVVHLVGQVAVPGLVRLPAGSRVDDAVRAAGGATAEADLTRVNLARPVVDGEQLFVPRPGEEVPAASGSLPAPAPGAAGPVPPASGPAGAQQGQPVDLNTATVEQLDSLPGIGPVLARRILDWRGQNGRFSSVDELGEVSGIGPKVLERLRPLVTV
ncbi:MAG: helix-hairpin-helix domain-containing protein [Actinomycetes bacterium]